ncbi:phage tail protein [Paraburkholderia bonniea]|uniref:phage tail protein n=1 Tax=Paraburkholderia bonniea TaxID=2152891 RepID=UPI001290DFB1|nr:phage tail protein [Paraburkholderia bonniea]WJF92005.1 phage tail protein [Paraburkholderia bonniea]WJF95324.1 phage tail protein [Paraburkholderia bonniea]
MTETFGWSPAPGPQGETTFAVRRAQFGDGYAQRVPDGINSRSDSWPVTFTGSREKIEGIKAFLDRHAGASAFFWTPPLGSGALFVCSRYSPVAHTAGTFALSATFEQTFNPGAR